MPKPETPDTESGEVSAEKLDFESAATQLERIIDDLEQGDVPLERSLDAYERGRRLVARCREILDLAASRMREVELEPLDREEEES